MEHASIKDVSFAQKRIDFCTEYIKRYNDPDGINIKNMKSAIAESYYVLGKIEEGDKLFEQYLKEDPKWGWGWIGWADQYWFWKNRETNDYNKAINILEQGLQVDNLEDRLDVLERLMDIYNELEMYEEAKQISDEIVKTKECQNESTIFSSDFFKEKLNPYKLVSKKVGRNDPCPCGSGKSIKSAVVSSLNRFINPDIH